jgi:hypothetical protein
MCVPMGTLERLRALTEDDLARHRRVVDGLPLLLFQRCHDNMSYVSGRPRVIEPHVNVRFDPSTGRPHREILLGGLEYAFELPASDGPRQICVQHWSANAFWLHASFQPQRTKARFTRFSLTTDVRELPRVFSDSLQILINEASLFQAVKRP